MKQPIGRGTLVCLLTLVPAVANGQESDRFRGTYVFSGGERERDARRDRIEELTSKMNGLLRPIARSVLTDVTKIPPRVVIQGDGESLAIALPPLPARQSSLDGTARRFRTINGTWATIRRVRSKNTIVETIAQGRRRRVITYRLSEDSNHLVLRWTIEAPLLPSSLCLRLSYRRL
jgi:hypothetical protein